MTASSLSCPKCHNPFLVTPFNDLYFTCYHPNGIPHRPPYTAADLSRIQRLVSDWHLGTSTDQCVLICPRYTDTEVAGKHDLAANDFTFEAVLARAHGTQLPPHPWQYPGLDWTGYRHVILSYRFWHPQKPGYLESWPESDGMGSIRTVVTNWVTRGRRKGSTAVSKEVFLVEYPKAYEELSEMMVKPPTRTNIYTRLGLSEDTFKRYLEDYHLDFPPK